MPLRSIGANEYERTPVAPGSRDYVATPGVVELLRTWYADGGYYWERLERPYVKKPDNWNVLEESEEDGRTKLLLCNNVTDACIAVSFRDEDGVPKDLELRPLPPEQAYQRLRDEDEKSRACHPKP